MLIIHKLRWTSQLLVLSLCCVDLVFERNSFRAVERATGYTIEIVGAASKSIRGAYYEAYSLARWHNTFIDTVQHCCAKR